MRSRPPPFLGDILSLGTYGGGRGVRGGEGEGVGIWIGIGIGAWHGP